MIKTTGAEYKRFYNDPTAWPDDSWYEDVELLVNGVELTPELGVVDIHDDAVINLSGGVVFGLPNGTETSVEAHFKRWRKRQTTTTFLVECDMDKVDEVKAAVKAAGGKVV